MTKQMLKGIRVQSKQELEERIYLYFEEVNKELQRHLFVDQKHIVHFLFKVRVTLFAVIFDLERL